MDVNFSRKISFYSFIYAILMICYHANANVHFNNINNYNTIVSNVASYINDSLTQFGGTYFFMILSAFLLYCNLDSNNIKDKILRRGKSLLVPWILWNLIGMITYHDFDKGILHIATYFITSRYCGAMWFVEMLILMLAFIPLFKKIFKIRGLSEIFLCVCLIFAGMEWPFLKCFPSSVLDQFGQEIYRIFDHLPAYCVGTYLGLNYSEMIFEERYSKYGWRIKGSALLFLCIGKILSSTIWGYILRILSPLFWWILLDKEFFSYKLKWWMQISFYTYAIHNFVLFGIGKIIKLSGIFAEQFISSTISIVFALIWRISLTGIAFPLIMLSAHILMKYTPKLYEMLSGGRRPRDT